jgi:hypothetical protein
MRYKTLLLVIFPVFLFGQTVKGTLVDAATQSPVAYVNIGILNKSIGTVSNDKGVFAFEISKQVKPSDTVMISMIGYESQIFKVSDFQKTLQQKSTISLTSKSYDLSEVTIIPKDFKTKLVGNQRRNENMSVAFQNNNMGHEMGVLLNIKKRPTYIEKVFINIISCTYDSIFYRLNIYEYDKKTKRPSKNVLQKPVYLSYTKAETQQTLEIDLSHLSVLVQDDFVVSVELVKDLGEGDINFSASFFKSRGFARGMSLGGWQRTLFRIGPGIYAQIRYEK